MVGGCSRIPLLQELIKQFFDGKAPLVGNHADHDVAKGAALQAVVLSGINGGQVQDLLLLDVTPLSIGYESAQGSMSRVIERNTTIPTKRSVILTTHEDNQRSVRLRLFEGERALCQDNNFLGEFSLDNLPPAPRGAAQIEVTFNIDADGILQVTARDLSTGKLNMMTVTNEKGTLKQSAIEKMIQEAAEDDATLMQSTSLPAGESQAYGLANAARVSRGSHEDEWQGLCLTSPRRDSAQRCTITVQFYHTVSGGVPSPEDVMAAIDDMESLYLGCAWDGRLAEKPADFAKSACCPEVD